MNIVVALKQEETKLQRQLKVIQGAITILNGSGRAPNRTQSVGQKVGVHRKRTLSASARAKISKATKERWAKFRAEKGKKTK
jgi:hypothetical protein